MRPGEVLGCSALGLRAWQIPCTLLDNQISAKASPLPEYGAGQPKPVAEFLSDAKVQKFLGAVASDLLANIGKSIVVAGLHQPAEVHALVERMNVLLGNVGRTVFYTEDSPDSVNSDGAALKALTDDMAAGRVEALFVLGGNPAYDAPSDVAFASALDPSIAPESATLDPRYCAQVLDQAAAIQHTRVAERGHGIELGL